jgi:hypothetical protein
LLDLFLPSKRDGITDDKRLSHRERTKRKAFDESKEIEAGGCAEN